ncbi:transketolase family protein [Rhodoblastus sp.]|uniref:transketolase family protein n=1 Tax=Rhodoblastus sp. TaxID=1962975 RepID=UPI003F957470
MRNRIIQLIKLQAAKDDNIVFLTGDLGFSVVEPLMDALGERFVNAGVAEANMIGLAAALAASGFHPFAYSIAPFITSRCYEQIRNDIAYQRRAVRLIGVGAGFSYGALGPSHHALEDATIMASLPNMTVVNPANVAELDQCYKLVTEAENPAYIRIARESGSTREVPPFSMDRGAYVVRGGGDMALVTSGVSVAECLRASDLLAQSGIFASVISVPVLQPFPKTELSKLIGERPVACVFEGYRGNPLATGVMEVLLEAPARRSYLGLHAPLAFPAVVGGTEALRQRAGLDASSIARAALGLSRRFSAAAEG